MEMTLALLLDDDAKARSSQNAKFTAGGKSFRVDCTVKLVGLGTNACKCEQKFEDAEERFEVVLVASK